ncbi:NAD(P)/FAD-dependent oxidoreductase [Hymenobacter sp. H14-R3]|uniref:phytoene desaturase family protein n=1 Tax=Hymenobacter sp. H14-R3 TaxID=3046308 RepID=UPI0024B9D945|nr:NAD(P)/FAD-dependent oxidoreductase [Hymenobacter sp. H14-R3]MDJ0367121.1 NAD(P)/FAD-dependent oxidoreductase [Hymenobacter sp. H14-R3]
MTTNTRPPWDTVIIGSGPNGLSAGIYLASKGLRVLILEAADSLSAGTRTQELTLPGYLHDVGSAVHPMAYLSPYFKTLGLEKHGLEWVIPEASVAHPLDHEEAVLLTKSVAATAQNLGGDAANYQELVQPFAARIEDLLADTLKPLGMPRSPLLLARFGLKAALPATLFAKAFFKSERARALFAGCAAHSVLPLDKVFTSAVGLLFLVTGHAENWAFPKGGAQHIAQALAACFTGLGGEIIFSKRITRFEELPPAKTYLFDTDPLQLASIARQQLPAAYCQRLARYRFGPGIFKIDYALAGPIPWQDPRCLQASTVHVGGTFAEIAQSEKAAWTGQHANKPFVMLCQQSQFDATRAPHGKHTGWAYCHVPAGSTKDMTPLIESQIERFAPGFRDVVVARRSMNTRDLCAYNPNYVGGAITGGAADIWQLFTRPVARPNPYSTPNPALFICSASTPPGGGVHGMCGYYAAQSIAKRLGVQE